MENARATLPAPRRRNVPFAPKDSTSKANSVLNVISLLSPIAMPVLTRLPKISVRAAKQGSISLTISVLPAMNPVSIVQRQTIVSNAKMAFSCCNKAVKTLDNALHAVKTV